MFASMVFSLFALIVFAPCMIACMVVQSRRGFLPDELYTDNWLGRHKNGLEESALQAAFPESPICEDFEIRSFAKGISQRRIVVRDTEFGPKLSIGEVRAAAVELAKLGGTVAAHQYALAVAAAAVVMTSVKDAFAIAAREVMQSARDGSAWREWGDVMTRDHVETSLWSEAPPKIQPKKTARLYSSGAWRLAAESRAARAA